MDVCDLWHNDQMPQSAIHDWIACCWQPLSVPGCLRSLVTIFLKIIANNKHWYWFSGRWNHLEGLSLDHGLRNRTVLEFGNARVVSNWITFPRTTQHFQWTNCEVLIRAWGVHPEPTESFTLAIGRWILYCLFRFN